ncbi:CGNR zinc finger domain-containing protein [Actinoplanes sp. NPDC026619]|uniref:CGNR zinc finger domain-containing protein n=1 Tax=Actinoplanes sp. NPDC026619 TaxID=3155798 RepID=UPI0033EBCB92
MRYDRRVATTITVMPMPELVELVNDWGTLPRTLDPTKTGTDPARTALADEFHPIFDTADGAERARLITALLDRTRVRPALATTPDGTLTQEWTVDDPANAGRAAAALALRHHLAEHPGRIGVCADDQCADVYVDNSPAGRRRFCCLTCQNRARAAAFRRRGKST